MTQYTKRPLAYWDAQIEEIKAMLADGKTTRQIAEHYNVSVATGRYALRRTGLAELSPYRKDGSILDRLYAKLPEIAEAAERMTKPELAERFDCSVAALEKFMSSNKISAARVRGANQWEPADLLRLQELAADGKSIEEISVIFGRSWKAVYNKLRAAGITGTKRRTAPVPKVRPSKTIKAAKPTPGKAERTEFSLPKNAKVVMPASARITIAMPAGDPSDPRHVMARPVYVPGSRTIGWRY